MRRPWRSNQAPATIAAYIVYCHPEYWKSQGLEALMSNELGTERKCTHMGLYVGNGKTLNSPQTYHGNVWQTRGYPAHVIIPVLKGVKQNVLSQSIHNKMAVTNDAVAFPGDYLGEDDIVRLDDTYGRAASPGG